MHSSIREQAEALIAEFTAADNFSAQVDALSKLETLTLSIVLVQRLPKDHNNLFIRNFLRKIHASAVQNTGDQHTQDSQRLIESNTLSPESAIINAPTKAPELALAIPEAPINVLRSGVVGAFEDLSDLERSLILNAFKNAHEEIDGYTIRSIKPGFSGAKVFAVFPYIGVERQPYPWIAKVGEVSKLRREWDNSNSATFRINSPPCFFSEQEGLACLLQKLASTSTNWPEPLHQKVWPGLKNLDRLCEPSTLKSIIDRFSSQYKLFSQCRQTRGIVSELFAPVISNIRQSRVAGRLTLYGLDAEAPHFEITGTDLRLNNPLYFFRRLTTGESPLLIDTYIRHLHGDLHCDNLQVDEFGSPCMIDWGNSGLGHYLIDVASLEISILMRCIPSGLSPFLILGLLESISHPTILCRDPASPTERARYCIQLLRDKLLDISPSRSEFDYELCLLLIAVQQIQYEDLDIWVALTQAHTSIESLKRSLPAIA